MDDPNVVSPGILGFLAFFFLAVALYLLLRNMNGHLRRMRYRAEQLEAEQAPPSGQQPATSEPGQEHEPEHEPEPEATPGPKPDGDTDRAG
ncbi:MAG: hypothetical protein ACJ71T_02795 [Actinomycetales bacterium]